MKKIEKGAWLEKGLNVLVNEGFQRITIENLCTLLQITKGSFYHHFKSIDGYTEELMKYWRNKNTVDLIEGTNKISDINKKHMQLNDLASSIPQKEEQIIRAWAFSNEIVRQYVQQVDDMRIKYLIDLNKEAGMDTNDAQDYATLVYGTLIGIQQLYPEISKEYFKHLYQVFIKKVGTHNK